MLNIKNISLKNFLSTGAVMQNISLNNQGLTLIIGENLDLGSAGSRNGTGKSTIIQALCYAFFDQPLTTIKKDNLINKTNSKNMIVVVEFSINNIDYRIERGRKPNVFRLFVNGQNAFQNVDSNDAQGEMKDTQKELERIIGISYEMFKQIIALNTYNTPFLIMKSNEQRIVIEELLGITVLSEKSEKLKELMKNTKDQIKEEELKVQMIIENNETILKSINSLKDKSKQFKIQKQKNITELESMINELKNINIDKEIDNHKLLQEYDQLKTLEKDNLKYLRNKEGHLLELDRRISDINSRLEKTYKHECPECGQSIHDIKHAEIKNNLISKRETLEEEVLNVAKEFELFSLKDIEIKEKLQIIGVKPKTFYNNLDDALNHLKTLENLSSQLTHEKEKEDNFIDQINSLNETGIRDVSYEKINLLKRHYDHQDFLYRLLTYKDSSIRKRIIDQNLAFLNNRLSYYLLKLGLPHQVEFKNDLTVEISHLGQDFDFGQLSRGQQNRIVLSLSWAFRDVWEGTGHPINLLFIDELIDSGIDTQGVENTLEILKKIARERNKDIFLISHREELLNRVNNVLNVIFENNFTAYTQNIND